MTKSLRRALLAVLGTFATLPIAACGDDAQDERDAAAPADAALDAGDGGHDAGALLGVAPASENDRWVSYANGPDSHFANPGEARLSAQNAHRLEMKWKIDAEVTAPPVVVDGRVYVTTGAQGLFAIDIASGQTLWQTPEVSSFSAPAYDPKTKAIYVNRWEGGVMHAFDAETGALRWMMPISDQEGTRGWSSPVVAGELLVVGIASSDRGMTFKGGLSVFDLAAQTRAFTYTHAEEAGAGCSVWGGPSVDVQAQVAFAGSGNNYTLADGHSDSLFALDLGVQEMLWNEQLEENDRWAYDCILCGPDHDFGTNPMLIEHAGRQLLAAGQKSGSFWLLDRMTGEVLWEKKVSTASSAAYGGVLNNGAFDGTRILVAGNEGGSPGTLFALDPDPDAGGRVIWQRALSGLVVAPITTAGGLAFVPVGRTLEVVDAASGETLSVLPAQAPVAGGAAVSHGYVFFGSGISYYDRGAEPGAFYAFGLGEGSDLPPPARGDEDGGGADATYEPGSPTFGAVYAEVIVGQGCNSGPLCHGGSVGGLQMSDRDAAFRALVSVPAMGTNTADATNPDCADTSLVRVVPGDPAASLLMQKLDPPDAGVPCGSMMPPTGKLPDERIEQIRSWIQNGAKDD